MRASILLLMVSSACRGAGPAECLPTDVEDFDPDVPPYTVCVELDPQYDGGTEAHAEDTLDRWRQEGLLRIGEVVWVDDDQVLCVYQPLCE